ncbi:MAG: BatD family protein [Luteimonas sp.]
MMSRKYILSVVGSLALLLAPCGIAHAQTRAWLDRDRIAMGETATLNIESGQLGAAPDYSGLQREFIVSGNTSNRQVQAVNGRATVRTLFAVALQPRRSGVIGIPALPVGGELTQALTLTVTPSTASMPSRAGQEVFIETEADDQDPYVQQAVGVVLRLYYSVPLISGELDLDQPEGATLQKVGEDLQFTRELGGRRYNVVERRYLLVPERSGTLTLPAARFKGQGVGGFFDDLFGDGKRALQARGAPRILRIRSAPANAPQPWLPLRDLQLRYVATPQNVRAGEAATVVVEATADGATAAQMPELQLAGSDGAQVFAEPAQSNEAFANGRPQVTVTRRFSIVPARAGALRMAGPSLDWWDVRADASRTAALPELNLQVAPGTGAFSAPAATDATTQASSTQRWGRIPGMEDAVGPWALASVLFALLWLGTLMWGLQRRTTAQPVPSAVPARPDAAPQKFSANLKRALDTGDLDDVGDALRAMAIPQAIDLDDVIDRLDDSAQRDAVHILRRARWGDGDGIAARSALRDAFKHGPRWRQVTAVVSDPLPPLYPRA